MSTLKTNNIEHLDASTPSIKTTIGGGVILAGVSTFQGDTNFDGKVSIAGTLTYEDVSSIDSVGIITAQAGINVTGGNVDIGGATHSRNLTVHDATNSVILIEGASNGTSNLMFADENDEDVGMLGYNHASNYLAFTVNAAERLRIDTSGRLLVGTSTSPTGNNGQYSLLVVQGQVGSTASGANISIQRGEAAAGGNITSGEGIGNINWSDNAGNTFGIIGCEADANAGSGDYPGRLVFATTADGASSTTERMRIDSSGNVGIGTDNPGANLHVKSSGATEIKSESTGDNALVSINNSSSIPWILTQRSDTSNGFSFRYNGNNYVNIDTSGNLGIGTDNVSNISNRSQVVIGGVDGGLLDFNVGGDTEGRLFATDGTGLTIRASQSDGNIIFQTSGSNERLRIDSSGNISIGVTSGNNNQSGFFVNVDGVATQHTSIISKGDFSTGRAAFYEAKGKHVTRGTSEVDIDLVQAIDAWNNVHTVVTFEFLVTCAVNDKAAKITGHAGFHRVGGGSFTYYTSTPSVTMLSGSGISAGSLSWVGSGNTQTLRYTTSAGTSYVKYMISDLKVTGHDYAPANIL